MQIFTGSDKKTILKFSIKRFDEKGQHRLYGYFVTNVDFINKKREESGMGHEFTLYDAKCKET